MTDSDAVGSLSPAEAAMLEYLVQREEPGALDFDAFCSARPHLEARLRELYAGVERLDRAIPRPRGPADELLERLGARERRDTRYEIHGEIARGGMGVVLDVWDVDLRRKLAMKVVRYRKRSAPERLIARFLEEAQITGQLQHPSRSSSWLAQVAKAGAWRARWAC